MFSVLITKWCNHIRIWCIPVVTVLQITVSSPKQLTMHSKFSSHRNLESLVHQCCVLLINFWSKLILFSSILVIISISCSRKSPHTAYWLSKLQKQFGFRWFIGAATTLSYDDFSWAMPFFPTKKVSWRTFLSFVKDLDVF